MNNNSWFGSGPPLVFDIRELIKFDDNYDLTSAINHQTCTNVIDFAQMHNKLFS